MRIPIDTTRRFVYLGSHEAKDRYYRIGNNAQGFSCTRPPLSVFGLTKKLSGAVSYLLSRSPPEYPHSHVWEFAGQGRTGRDALTQRKQWCPRPANTDRTRVLHIDGIPNPSRTIRRTAKFPGNAYPATWAVDTYGSCDWDAIKQSCRSHRTWSKNAADM